MKPNDRRWVHAGHLPSAAGEPLLVDLHAGHSAAHDHLVEPGAFERTVALLASLAGQDVQVATWIARPNFRSLGAVPRLLAKLGVQRWRLRVLRSAPTERWDRMTPRLALAMPRALHAADLAERLRIEVTIEGAPSCLLGPMARLASEAPTADFASSCAECAARPSCSGVSAEYLTRFGDEDLRQVRAG